MPEDLHAAQVTAHMIRLAWTYPTDALVVTSEDAGEADAVSIFRVQVRLTAYENIVSPTSPRAALFVEDFNVSVIDACAPHAKNASLYVCLFNVSDLRPFTEYIIRISAATSLVQSPPSPQYQLRTSESSIDLTFILHLFCSHLSV